MTSISCVWGWGGPSWLPPGWTSLLLSIFCITSCSCSIRVLRPHKPLFLLYNSVAELFLFLIAKPSMIIHKLFPSAVNAVDQSTTQSFSMWFNVPYTLDTYQIHTNLTSPLYVVGHHQLSCHLLAPSCHLLNYHLLAPPLPPAKLPPFSTTTSTS